MAKKSQKSSQVSQLAAIYDRPWKHALAVIIGFVAVYFAASWAIDSGRLLVYALTIFLIMYALRHMVLGLKQLYGK